jgi:hypothetical protein
MFSLLLVTFLIVIGLVPVPVPAITIICFPLLLVTFLIVIGLVPVPVPAITITFG